MEDNKMTIVVNLERPLNAQVEGNQKLVGFMQYLETQGYIEPGSYTIDETNGVIKAKATEGALQFAEKHLK